MTELVIKLYRTLAKNRALFYTLLIATSALFVFLGSKVVYEEDISKLLPSTDESKSAGFAFNNLKVKDKIFIEFLLKDTTQYNEETYYTLAEAADSFSHNILCTSTFLLSSRLKQLLQLMQVFPEQLFLYNFCSK